MEKLKFKDVKWVQSLLEENNLPVSDLKEEIIFFAERKDDTIIAAGGLESAGNDAIIRSIAVSNNFKGQGFGAKITRQLLKYARDTGKKDIYLLTTTAETYFPKYGFKKIDRHSVPDAVKNSSQYKDVCPDTAVIMKLDFAQNK